MSVQNSESRDLGPGVKDVVEEEGKKVHTEKVKVKVKEVDEFDTIVLGEQGAYDKGFKEGLVAGTRRAASEGFTTGIQVAVQVGADIGFYEGFCKTILKDLEENSIKDITDDVSQALKSTLQEVLWRLSSLPEEPDEIIREIKAIQLQLKNCESLFPPMKILDDYKKSEVVVKYDF